MKGIYLRPGKKMTQESSSLNNPWNSYKAVKGLILTRQIRKTLDVSLLGRWVKLAPDFRKLLTFLRSSTKPNRKLEQILHQERYMDRKWTNEIHIQHNYFSGKDKVKFQRDNTTHPLKWPMAKFSKSENTKCWQEGVPIGILIHVWW